MTNPPNNLNERIALKRGWQKEYDGSRVLWLAWKKGEE